MPRGKRGGGGRRGGKSKGFNSKREMVFKEEGQEYAQCTKLLGSGRMTVHCFDGKDRLAKIRGKFKRRVWVNIGDVILVQKRDLNSEDDKCDIIYVYYADEVKRLKSLGELPKDLEFNEKNDDEKNLNVVFGEEEKPEVDEKPEGKKGKQNLNDFMPSDSDSEEEQDLKKTKKNDTKIVNDEPKVKKPLTPVESESESEEKKSNSDSEEEVDELDDI
jgi:translation initiation factor 1A